MIRCMRMYWPQEITVQGAMAMRSSLAHCQEVRFHGDHEGVASTLNRMALCHQCFLEGLLSGPLLACNPFKRACCQGPYLHAILS